MLYPHSQILDAAAMVATSARRGLNPTSELDDARCMFEKISNRMETVTLAAPIKNPSVGENLLGYFEDKTIADGDVWRIQPATIDIDGEHFTDTGDGSLAAAKGSALADQDVFQRVGDALQYIGPAGQIPGLEALFV
jgi:hypothetical protein